METSHREIGVFDSFGLVVVQPYATVVPEFLQVPLPALVEGGGKHALYRRCFGELLPRSINGAKIRAQIGSAGSGGVLGACIRAGVDQRYLELRFAQLHGCSDVSALRRFIRAGRYRARIPGAVS